jgi:hypothetical protein
VLVVVPTPVVGDEGFESAFGTTLAPIRNRSPDANPIELLETFHSCREAPVILMVSAWALPRHDNPVAEAINKTAASRSTFGIDAPPSFNPKLTGDHLQT